MPRKIRVVKPSKRRGLGKGKGKGYKNIIPQDPKIHSDSAKGKKQPEKVNVFMLKGLAQNQKRQILREIADNEGLQNKELFVSFMLKAFPNEFVKSSYTREWARRFASGDPVAYMDKKRKLIFIDLIKKGYR